MSKFMIFVFIVSFFAIFQLYSAFDSKSNNFASSSFLSNITKQEKNLKFQKINNENSLMMHVKENADNNKNTYLLVFDFSCAKCLNTINDLSSTFSGCPDILPLIVSIDKDENAAKAYSEKNDLNFALYSVERKLKPMQSFSDDMKNLKIDFTGGVPLTIVFDKDKKVLFQGDDVDASLKLRSLLCNKRD